MTPGWKRTTVAAFFVFTVMTTSVSALAQCLHEGPDIAVGDISGPTNYASQDGFDALSFGLSLCNIGNVWVDSFANTNRHPLMGTALFRLKTVNGSARFEQLGHSWLFHNHFALSQQLCCTACQATDGTHIGVSCMDAHTADVLGSQAGLSPKWQVNVATGMFPYPPANPPYSGSTARRLQVLLSDLQPSSSSVQYFGEVLTVAPDDAAAGNDRNNASYRKVTAIIGTPAQGFTFAFSGSTVREQAAIRAWRASDPAVVESDIPIPSDGLMIMAARATDLGGDQWHYEYALYNMNSDRSGQSFSIPVPAGVSVTNFGFHDVDYHDGDGINNVNRDGTDWTPTRSGCRLMWATQTHSENPNGNALRWGTLYNFRFDANAAPLASGGVATIGLFTPGTPASITSGLIPVPGSAALLGDLHCDGMLNNFDIDAFTLAISDPASYDLQYPACDIAAGDVNGDGMVNNFDIDPFVQCLTTGDCGC